MALDFAFGLPLMVWYSRGMTTITAAIAAINDFSLALAADSASDSTLDDMQLRIDAMLFDSTIDDDLREEIELPAPLTDADFADTFFTLKGLRDYAIAALNLRP
jgi:hypothetical protein